MAVAITDARAAAEAVIDLIHNHCQRIEIAGSIRRGKENPKDAELVIIPAPTLLSHLDALVASGTLAKARYGEKHTTRWGANYRGIDVDGVKVELFMATPETWGYIYWLRTGPGDANTHVMKWRAYTKASSPWEARDGAIYDIRTGEQLIIADERDMFAVLGTPYLEPYERTLARYEQIFRRGHQWGDVSVMPRVSLHAHMFDAVPAAAPSYTGDITGCYADAYDLANADTTSEYWQARIRFILRGMEERLEEKRQERYEVVTALDAMRKSYAKSNAHDRAVLEEQAAALKARLWSIDVDELPRLERLRQLYEFYRIG